MTTLFGAATTQSSSPPTTQSSSPPTTQPSSHVQLGTRVVKSFVVDDQPPKDFEGSVTRIKMSIQKPFKVVFDADGASYDYTWVQLQAILVDKGLQCPPADAIETVPTCRPGPTLPNSTPATVEASEGAASTPVAQPVAPTAQSVGLSNCPKSSFLKVELAVMIDGGKTFVDATKNTEGSHACVILEAYDIVEGVTATCRVQSWPNVRAVIHSLVCELPEGQRETTTQAWQAHSKSCLSGAYKYFAKKFDENSGEMADVVQAFKAARVFHPGKAKRLHEAGQCSEGVLPSLMQKLPFLPAALIEKMEVELPTYLTMCGCFSTDVEKQDSDKVLSFWSDHHKELPNWFLAFRMVMAASPNSADAERVFSQMRNTFGAQQKMALRDLVEGSMMIEHNSKQRNASN